MVGLMREREALIYFHFILDLRAVVAKRNFITSALVKCREHAMMKPTLWSVAGNYFSYEVCASFSPVPLASRAEFFHRPSFHFSFFRIARRNIEMKNFPYFTEIPRKYVSLINVNNVDAVRRCVLPGRNTSDWSANCYNALRKWNKLF